MSIEKKNRREKKRMRKQRYLCFQNERFPDIPKKKRKKSCCVFRWISKFSYEDEGKKKENYEVRIGITKGRKNKRKRNLTIPCTYK